MDVNCRQPTNAPILYKKTVIAQGIICSDVTVPVVCNCTEPNVAQQCFIVVIQDGQIVN